jgi:Protein of unknown function (DUF669)
MSIHKLIVARRYALASSLLSAFAVRMADDEDGETLGIIELEDNLADAEKPPELPAGNYTGEIQSVEVATSQKGNEYFAIAFKIAPSEIPADMQDDFEDGATLYYNRIVKPKKGDRRGLYNLRQFIEKIGLDSNTTTIDPNQWMGQEARLKVVHEKYQGESRAQIKSIESAEGRAPSKTAVKEEAPAPKKAAGARGRR